MAKLVEISDDGEEQPLRSVMGVNGLREFIMLPEWTVNHFVSTIKENHLKPLGKITISQRTYPSFYFISQRNATMTV